MSDEKVRSLREMTRKELLAIAKDLNVSKRWDMKKDELIEAIEKSSKQEIEKCQGKMNYVENVELGTLVAFRLRNGRVKSAKVIKKSSQSRKLKLQTNYGAEFVVSYDDVLWVRTGKRWPRGVYNLLKGIKNDAQQE